MPRYSRRLSALFVCVRQTASRTRRAMSSAVRRSDHLLPDVGGPTICAPSMRRWCARELARVRSRASNLTRFLTTIGPARRATAPL
jgi:hypothetical protein